MSYRMPEESGVDLVVGREAVVHAGETKRIYWTAIAAGVVIALVLQLTLSMLGMGIGMASWSPGQDVEAFSARAGLWWGVSALLALFLGGVVASRLSGLVRRGDGILHGLVTWATTMLAVTWLVTSQYGALVGGAFGAVGTGLRGIPAGADAADDLRGQVGGDDDGLAAIRAEGHARLSTPETRADFDQALAKVLEAGQPAAGDYEALANILTSQGGLTRAEAEQTIQGWRETYQSSRSQIGATIDRYARDLSEQATSTVAQASLWMFFALALGAVAAALGGVLGRTRRRLAVVEEVPTHH